MKLLLDTNICIHLIKNNPPEVKRRFDSLRLGDVGISAISVAELHYGAAKSAAVAKNARALEAFLLPLEILPFDAESAAAYGPIRANLERWGVPIGSLDLLIAAQAMANDLILITNKLKEFARIQGIRCETWLSPKQAEEL